MLKTGVSCVDITPPVGISLVGFAEREPSSIGVHDRLKATSLVISDGEMTAALASSDLLHVDDSLVKMVREEANRRTGIPEKQITVACTHTHYGPAVAEFEASLKGADYVAAYRACLKFYLAGGIQEAFSNMQEASLGLGWGTSHIGINRRERCPDGRIILGQNPEGPVDRTVGVIRLQGLDHKPLACIVNFACHPVSQSWKMRLISADYPGKTREIVETLTGANFLFLQGACGNINPVLMNHTYEPARNLGTQLGCEVVRIWAGFENATAESLASVSETVAVPRYDYGSRERAEGLVTNLRSQVERLQAEGAVESVVKWNKTRLRYASEALESWTTGKPMPSVNMEIQAWRIGDIGMVFVPGEVFDEIGTYIKQHSPFHHTFFVGYANGNVGYVPTPKAYVEGGYEVEEACQVNPEAAGLITEKCLELLRKLYQKT